MATGFLHHQPEENLCFWDHFFQLCGSKLPLTLPWGLNVLICGESDLSLKAFGNSQVPLAALRLSIEEQSQFRAPDCLTKNFYSQLVKVQIPRSAEAERPWVARPPGNREELHAY